jgi:ribosomal protein L7/L12
VDFFELSFERDQSRPNYAELVQLEKQYEPCGSGFDVILIDDGAQVKGNAQRSNVAEVLRSHGFDFDESFRLVEKGIATIKKAVTKADAEKLRKDMEDAGAKVMLTETNVRLSVEAKVNIPSWPSYPHLSKEPERLEFFGCLWSILALIGLLFYIVPGVVVIIWRNQKYIEAKKIWDEECAAHEKKLDVYRKEYDVYRKELADCRANYVEQLEIAEKKFQEILEKARSLV